MTQQLLTLGEFCTDLPEWYEASTRNEYWAGWTELLDRLPAKADELGYFDMRDLCDIAEWGGNQHGVKQRMQSGNTPDHVKRAAQLAIRRLDDPAGAMRAIAGVKHWGIAYRVEDAHLHAPLGLRHPRQLDSESTDTRHPDDH